MSGFTYPLAFPSHTGVSGATIRSRKIVGVSTAPFSFVQQVYEHPGQRWEADISLPILTRANAEIWRAWLLSLDGPIGTFLMGDPAGATPRGSAATTPGTPQVDGAHAVRSKTLSIKTGLGTVANYLRAGDWISLGTGSTRRLHAVVSDASLSGGKASLDIRPALRAALNGNETVYVASATGRFRLNSPSVEHVINQASHFQLNTISCVEAL